METSDARSAAMDWRTYDDFSQTGTPDSSEPWPVPSRKTMQERWDLRKSMRDEGAEHRRIHEHGGMAHTGRNIMFTLRDREIKGGNAVILTRRRHRESWQSNGAREDTTEDRKTEDYRGRQTPLPFTSECYPTNIQHEIRVFAEYCSVIRFDAAFFRHLGGQDVRGEDGVRPSSSKAVSTISIAFSPDSKTMASTHGDHTVKITCCGSGRLLETLEGHPRTPWTVKYHPIDSRILASGCLGQQVRLWNWHDRVCLQMIRLEFAVISLSFHPEGNLLAMANGTRLHFWGFKASQNQNDSSETTENRDASDYSRGVLTEIDQGHMLRCVHFPPGGNTIIIGGVNPTTDDPRWQNRGGIGGSGMTFYLRLYDFDVDAALRPWQDFHRRAISQPRTFVPRAHLYNDGGFDVSPDGKVLCACAEYWLPKGIDNAMELLQHDDSDDEVSQGDQSDGNDEMDDDRQNEASNPGKSAPAGTSESDELLLSPPSNQIQSGYPFTPAKRNQQNVFLNSKAVFNDYVPLTPPGHSRPRAQLLSPPSPPGRRFLGGVVNGRRIQPMLSNEVPNGPVRIPPPPPGIRSQLYSILDHSRFDPTRQEGRYVPHIVTVSLDTSLSNVDALRRSGVMGLGGKGCRPRLGELLEASPLVGAKASAVTCVKFSPSTDFCLIGYGVREPVSEGGGQYHPVTALYRVRGGMTHVSTMLSADDDVNIARFHPDSGYGFVYGTKQGRVGVLSPRPWHYYNC